MYNWLLSIVLGSLLIGILAFFYRIGGGLFMGELIPALGVMLRVTVSLILASGVLSLPYVILANIAIMKVSAPEKQRNRIWAYHWVGSILLFGGMTVLGAMSLHWTFGLSTLPYILFGSIFLAYPIAPPRWFPI